jgi:hypothetical protein
MVSDVRNMDCMEFMKQFPDKPGAFKGNVIID